MDKPSHRAPTARGAARRGPSGNPLDPYRYPGYASKVLKDRLQKALSRGPLKLLVLGAGANFYDRVLKPLALYAACGAIKVVVADVNPGALGRRQVHGVSYVLVHGDDDLKELIADCDLLIIQTWQESHPRMVRLGLAARVPGIVCEKPAADIVARCAGLVDEVRRAFPRTVVLFVDHYAVMPVYRKAVSVVEGGDTAINPIEVNNFAFVLRETAAISKGQISQRQGAKEPLHHAVELMRVCVGLDGWEVGPCFSAIHPQSPVAAPTYAALSFQRPATNQTAHLLVAKMQQADEKVAYLTGHDGRLLVADRASHTVQVGDATSLLGLFLCAPDSGYEGVFAGLLERDAAPAPLLTVHEAMEVLRFTEDAVLAAARLPNYPTCNWMPRGFGCIARSRATLERWARNRKAA